MCTRFSGSTTVQASVRIGVLLAAGVVGWGCRTVPAVPTSQCEALRLLDAKADTGISLRAALLRDTVPAWDSAPVELAYAIVNGPRPTLFDNHPGRYRILVTGPDDQPATSLGGAGPVLGTAELRTGLMLPAGGSLIQRQDLRCVNDLAYSAVPLSPGKDVCLAMYALTAPGRYRVVVEYFGPEADSAIAALQRREVQSLSKLRPTPGVHLADTTTFVVVGR